MNYYFNYKNYDQILFEKEQNDYFNYYGLDRKKGFENLNFIKKKLSKNIDVNREMSSEHEVFFFKFIIKQKS